MNPLYQSIDATFQRIVPGENGMLEEKTTSSLLLDLFFKLVRNIPEEELMESYQSILTSASETGNEDLLIDLVVMTFQTRDVRGGKGEKKIFYTMIIELFKMYPDTVIMLLSIIPEYGYFKDLMNLYLMIHANESFSKFSDALITSFATQLQKDKQELESSKASGKTPSLSFAGKFAPREGKTQFSTFYKKLLRKLFGKSKTAQQQYRKFIVELTATLEVPEVFMCAGRYHEITFSKVPSLCLNRFRKAFLNELVVKKGKHSIPLSESEEETGNRFPDDEGRVACRQALRKATIENKVCGKVLLPHELVSQLLKKSLISRDESLVYDAQWQKIIEGVLETTSKFLGTDAPLGINFGKLLALVDVSGSMAGTPMEVSIALGILVSMTSDPAWRDRFITFHERPSWVNLAGYTSLHDKVKATASSPWGGSTNFEAAFEMILQSAISARLTPEQIPDLIVFSDMQFNQAGKFSETMLDVMKRRFAEAGVKICGTPYPAPKIIFWNLRGDTRGYPATATASNVQLLSGFSPSLLKLLLSGEPMVTTETSADGAVTSKQVTPDETLRKALDDDRYDLVRLTLSQSNEGLLEKYTFVKIDDSV